MPPKKASAAAGARAAGKAAGKSQKVPDAVQRVGPKARAGRGKSGGASAPKARAKTAKAPTTEAAAAGAAATPSTPFERHFARLDAMIDATKDGVGSMLIRGVPRKKKGADDDEDDEDDEGEDEDADTKEPDPASYAEADMGHMRHIIITTMLENAEKAVLGDQAGHSFAMFNTSFSYKVRGNPPPIDVAAPRCEF